MYKPHFTITSKTLSRSISITEKLTKISLYDSLDRMPILRRNNRIRSVHSSLEIEANSLSLSQIKDIISGVHVIGPEKEILEVKNAYKAYQMIDKLNPYSEKDLLKAHKILTDSLVKNPGTYRNHKEAVYSGNKIIFVAPPEDMVGQLIKDLFDWLKKDEETPLIIKSCVFHYEFVFIHPFSDGNGRVARLWQNVLLSKWNNLFEYLPIESKIKKYQNEYYQAISKSNANGNSNVFIDFMLKIIDESLDELLTNSKKESRNISLQVTKLLEVMEYDIPISANEIMQRLNIKSKETLRNSYLNPAIKNGLVKLTIEDKPTSKNQKYYKK